MQVRYDEHQLHAAGFYLATFHGDVHSSMEEACAFIIAMIKEYARDDGDPTFYVNSGCVQVCFSRDEPEYTYVEIYVDPVAMYRDIDGQEEVTLEI